MDYLLNYLFFSQYFVIFLTCSALFDICCLVTGRCAWV